MITQTSLEAYESIQEELKGRQMQVYNVIKENIGITNAEIAITLKLGVNQVTPRVLELRKKGVVASIGYGYDKNSGRRCTIWGVVSNV